MNQVLKIILGFSLVLTMTACGGSDDSDPSNQEVTRTVYKINGQSPEDFYGKFLLKIQGDCKSGYVVYHYPKSYSVKIGSNVFGHDVRGLISLVMKEDRSYRVIYEEHMVLSAIGGASIWVHVREKIVSGTWKIVENRLLFENLGEAYGLLYNDRPALRIQFDQDLISAGLAGKEAVVVLSMAGQPPFPDLNPCLR